MGQARQLERPPSMIGSSLKAALALLPSASRLPFVAGGGGELPDTTLHLAGALFEQGRLETYARVCGFASPEALPPTAPHLLAFPLHMALMSEGSFPLAPIALVHISNTIRVHRPIGLREPLDLCVRAVSLEPHARGLAFTLLTEARAGRELVWEEHSTMLRRGVGGAGGGDRSRAEGDRVGTELAQWELPADLGRRYGAVSRDLNPIHIHPLIAKAFGFPRAIAHGMWAQARVLAALERRLPASYTVEVNFRRPILLPARVVLAVASDSGEFEVRSGTENGATHLQGRVTS
jgi:acyl dehydratase